MSNNIMQKKNEVTYYFSGAYSQELKIELNVDQLFTIYHEKKLVEKIIKYKREHPEYTAKLMLDSGAFTLYQNSLKKGHVLTDEEMQAYVDEYLAFLNEWGDDLTCFVAVDTVPNPEDVDQTFAQKTWDNYLYMYSKLRPEIRDKLIPVFHYGEDFKWLKNFLEYRHEDGTPIRYIGLAISLEGTRDVRITWATKCRKIINESSNPNVMTHAFGVGVKSVLDHIQVTSTDATSWVKRAAYGMISIDDKTIYISDIQKAKFNGSHYTEKSKAYQEEVEKRITDWGFRVSPDDVTYTVLDDKHVEFTTSEGKHIEVKEKDPQKLDVTIDNEPFEYELEAALASDSLWAGTWKCGQCVLVFGDNNQVSYDNGKCLATNCYARARFNIMDTINWCDKLRTDSVIGAKEELW